jgi:hypothetical protein
MGIFSASGRIIPSEWYSTFFLNVQDVTGKAAGRIFQRPEQNPDASTKTCMPAGSLMGPLLATSSTMALWSCWTPYCTDGSITCRDGEAQ